MFPQIAIPYKENVQKTHLLLILLVPRAPDSSRGMRTSLVVSRGTYKCILKFRLKLYKNLFINDRTKTFHRKNPYFNILNLVSIIMGGSLPKFQDTRV